MKPLMKYRCTFNKEESWGLAPIGETPVIRGIYDPREGTLALIYNFKKEVFKFIPRVDDTGAPLPVKRSEPASNDNTKQERVRFETYAEHYLSTPEDINFFLETQVENNFTF